MVDQLLLAGMAFGRNCIGIVTRPYETYRRIVERGSAWELTYIGLLLTLYFATASIVKTNAFRPFLLTKQFVLLAGASAVTYLVVVATLWGVSLFVRKTGKLQCFALAWAYTLIPTVLWFFATSLLSVILPPPRTTSAAGVIFSLLFLVFSATLFFWKAMLAYLALRFAMKLDLAKILMVVGISLPIIGLYSFGMYRFGIFKVPFL